MGEREGGGREIERGKKLSEKDTAQRRQRGCGEYKLYTPERIHLVICQDDANLHGNRGILHGSFALVRLLAHRE